MRKVFLLAALLLVLALPFTASAQKADNPGGLDPNGTPIWGNVTILAPFVIDPYVATIGIGGTVDVSTSGVGDGCLGFTDALPSFIFNLNGTTPALTFALLADEDATLVVSKPDGTYSCDDDSGGSLNPLLTISNATAGAYAIWAGRYSQDTGLAYLFISETSVSLTDMVTDAFGAMVGSTGSTGSTDSPATDRLDASFMPNYGSADLASGFTPDPFSVAVVSGNAEGSTVDVSALNISGDFSCRGYATVSPDFIVNWGGGAGALRIFYEADADSTLIIQQPDGSFVCNDDFSGLDPLVDIATPQAGEYVIWVGSYVEGNNAAGTLYVTQNMTLDQNGV
jgi:hypothetical protein